MYSVHCRYSSAGDEILQTVETKRQMRRLWPTDHCIPHTHTDAHTPLTRLSLIHTLSFVTFYISSLEILLLTYLLTIGVTHAR